MPLRKLKQNKQKPKQTNKKPYPSSRTKRRREYHSRWKLSAPHFGRWKGSVKQCQRTGEVEASWQGRGPGKKGEDQKAVSWFTPPSTERLRSYRNQVPLKAGVFLKWSWKLGAWLEDYKQSLKPPFFLSVPVRRQPVQPWPSKRRLTVCKALGSGRSGPSSALPSWGRRGEVHASY